MVLAVVLISILIVVFRFRAKSSDDNVLPPQIEGNNRLELVWTVGPVVLLTLLSVGLIKQSFALGKVYPSTKALQVDVTGHQFWWQIQYPESGVVTANELHIPVGQKVELQLTSTDVMHALWVPRLGGKIDLVPGRTNYLWLEASQPGVYQGQCAEYCGTGHAFMRFEVVAESPARFNEWTQAMLHPQSQPTTALARQGYYLFGHLPNLTCSNCHAIGGTPFKGAVGPNLTDLSDRLMIAANILPNTPQNLAAWLHNPQAVKPGALMPNLHLKPDQIRALVAYLDSLK